MARMSADGPIEFSPHRNNLVAFLGMLVSEIDNTARGSNIDGSLGLLTKHFADMQVLAEDALYLDRAVSVLTHLPESVSCSTTQPAQLENPRHIPNCLCGLRRAGGAGAIRFPAAPDLRTDHAGRAAKLPRDRPHAPAVFPPKIDRDPVFHCQLPSLPRHPSDYDGPRQIAYNYNLTAHIRCRGEESQASSGHPNYKPRRWVVERGHSWINRFRRLLIRWEKKPQNYEAMR
jgi:hypothetical protein